MSRPRRATAVASPPRSDPSVAALRLGPLTWTAIGLATAVGVLAFGWPLVAEPGSFAVAHAQDAPWLFVALVPLVLAVIAAQVGEGGMDAKAIALLGLLTAIACILRPLGAGIAGIEPIWVVIVLGGRALGPGFGFALGSLSLGASALLTGGVGPWLPFQMIAAAWVGCGAGLLPRARGRREVVLVTAYGAIAAMLYGLAMNLWFWPFAAGFADTSISFVPGAPPGENLARWLAFSVATSWGFDIPRALLTGVLLALLTRPALAALRRAARRAAFTAPVAFHPAPAAPDRAP